jgi:molybdopterin-guanine dinucleotide biosynthesis protein A
MTTGIVVAGGSSLRFGSTEKALVPIDGTPMLRRIVDRVVPLVDRLVVNVRQSQRPSFATALADVPCPIEFAIDRHVDRGPVAGLGRALDVVDSGTTLVLACDLPLLRTATLSSLLERFENDTEGGSDCVLPLVDGYPQPLCGAYAVDVLDRTVGTLGSPRDSSFHEVLDRLRVSTVPGERLPGGPDAFENVNTRSDLRNVRSRLRSRETTAGRP